MARRFMKLALDIYRDPKVRRYLPDDGDKWCWVAMLCYAKECAEPGVITDELWELAERLDVAEDRITRVVDAFTRCPRPPITYREGDNALLITKWDVHQVVYESDTKEARRERGRAYRERKKNSVTTDNDRNDVTQNVTAITKKTTSEERRGDEITSPPNPPQAGGGVYPDEFEAFWKAYPKKKAKGNAFRAWGKIKGRPKVDDLVAAIERDKRTPLWQKDGGAFIKHPATWLNARCWEDEPEVEAEGSAEVPYMTPAECEEAQRKRKADREAQLVRLYGSDALKQTRAGLLT